MKSNRSLLAGLLALFLICAAAARWMDTNGGKILIHKVPVEITEDNYHIAKLYRPIEAQALNRRPAVVLVDALQADPEASSSLAIEFARRGFVALSVSPRIIGKPSDSEPTDLPLADGWSAAANAYIFLKAQPFVVPDLIGLTAVSFTIDPSHQSQTETGFQDSLSQYQAIAWLGSDPALAESFIGDHANILQIGSDADAYSVFRPDEKKPTESLYSPHLLLSRQPSVIALIIDHFHQALSIPNDSPFWFTSSSQTSWLREILLFLGTVILLAVMIPLTALTQSTIECKGTDNDSVDQDKQKSDLNRFRISAWLIPFLGIIAFLLILTVLIQKGGDPFKLNSAVLFTLFIFIHAGGILLFIFFGNRRVKQRIKCNSWTACLIAILRSLLLVSALYLTILVFSRLFMIDFPLLKPLPADQLESALKLFLPCLLIYGLCAFSNLSFRRRLLVCCCPIAIILLIHYLPLTFAGQSGWESIAGWFEFDPDSSFRISWGTFIVTLETALIVFGLLLGMQVKIERRTHNPLISAFIPALISAWILTASGVYG